MDQHQNTTDYSQFIAENFGANATYVEGLLERFRSNPALVDEAWRTYFAELTGDSSAAAAGNGQAATGAPRAAESTPVAATEPTAQTTTSATSTPSRPATQATPATVEKVASGTPVTGTESQPIRGAALKIVENMEASLGVPTATSNRHVPVKLLEENRAIINEYLKKQSGGKASYTHLIAFAILRALEKFPRMNDGFVMSDGAPARVSERPVNLGLAIDLEKKDGTRTLLVPNIKNAGALDFAEFLKAYDDIIKRARGGKLGIPDFQETTVSLTNPGTIGTVSSTPRLMAGQSLIVATGAIEFPAEYSAMAPEALSQLGISKVINISSTYDHRIVQGAESGAFLALVHALLVGEHDFYDSHLYRFGDSVSTDAVGD